MKSGIVAKNVQSGITITDYSGKSAEEVIAVLNHRVEQLSTSYKEWYAWRVQ